MSFQLPFRTLVLFALITLASTSVVISGRVATPLEMTETAVTDTQVRIHRYMKEHRTAPPNLSVLPKRKGYMNRITDGWGRELHYSVDKKGVITLSSLGADGKPGGDGPNRDIVHRYETRNPDGSLNIDDKDWITREIRQPDP